MSEFTDLMELCDALEDGPAITRLFTLKTFSGNIEVQKFEYLLMWHRKDSPTLADFKSKYGDLLYEPFHLHDKVVELVEKT